MRQEKKYVVKQVAWPVRGQKLQRSYRQEVHEAEKHFQPKPNRRMIVICREKRQGKYLKGCGRQELNPFSTFAAISSDCPARDFCLVIGKELSNRIVMSTKYHLCWWTEAATATLKEWGKGEFWTEKGYSRASAQLLFHKERNDLWGFLTVTSKYTAQPLAGCGGRTVIKWQT